MMKHEHNEHCKSIADNLEAIANGEMMRCPQCGNDNTREEWHHGHTADGEGRWTCPDCGDVFKDDEIEPLSLYDWAEGVLDVRYTCNADKELIGAEFLVAFGGPNIWVDAVRGEVRLNWWNESGSASLSADATRALDELTEELWGW